MKMQIPPSLQNCKDPQVVIDATYYLVRVLRNSKRGFKDPTVSTEPTPEARELAKSALREIEAYEMTKVSNLTAARVAEYITALEDLLRTTYLRTVGGDAASASRLLDEMRSSKE